MSDNNLKGKIRLSATITSDISTTSPVILGGDPADSISILSDLGYDGVELHWGNPSQIDFNKIIESCDQHNIAISALATGRAYVEEGLSLIDDNESKRQSAIKRLLDFVDAASPFQSTVIIGCIRGNLTSSQKYEDFLNRLAESTVIVSEYAETKNVQIVFEAINRYENNYLNNATETLDFVNKFSLPNTKILLDTFHMNIEDANMSEAIENCGRMLGYMHFADSNRYYVGGGHINFSQIATALRNINYNGFISAECLPLPDSNTAIRKWIEGIKTAFQTI